MARLDKEKQTLLEPERLRFAKQEIEKRGLKITSETETCIKFLYKGETISIFPYSGWHTGKGIKDGRGIHRLLKQLDYE